ncbi:MAG: small ribosomal subunit Rsm22 family protein [Thermodesulfovibrio sp.]|nr:small ribosomal subunit Rsm22 family protein [Thermodesulfovibrio sp.]
MIEKDNLFLKLVFPDKAPTKGQIKNLILKTSDLFTFKNAFRPSDYMHNEDFLKGYILYFVPVNVSKHYSVFKELFRHPVFIHKRELKILDIGCGPSPVLLSLFDLMEKNVIHLEHIRYIGIESEERAISIAEKLIRELKPEKLNLKYDFIRADASDLKIYQNLRKIKPDIIFFSNSLGEMFEKGEIKLEDFIDLMKSFSYKNSELTLIIIEPGTKQASMRLHRLRDSLIEEIGFYPFSPCLNDLPCSALKAKNWCYEERTWKSPTYLNFLSSLGLQIKYLKFSYIVLRKDRSNIKDTFENGEEIIKNTSHLLNEKGKSRLWACWKGELIDMEKLKRDFREAEEWLKIKKGDYFSIDKYIALSNRKVRIPKDCKIKILYSP